MKNIKLLLKLAWQIIRPATPKGWRILIGISVSFILYVIGAVLFDGMVSVSDWKLCSVSPNPSILEHLYSGALSLIVAPAMLVFSIVTTMIMVLITWLSYLCISAPIEVEKCKPVYRLVSLVSVNAFPAFTVEFWRILYHCLILRKCLPLEDLLRETCVGFAVCFVLFAVGGLIWVVFRSSIFGSRPYQKY